MNITVKEQKKDSVSNEKLITAYRVFYLVETIKGDGNDYELELMTDNEDEAWGRGNLFTRRLEENPKLKEELIELCGENYYSLISHNYNNEFDEYGTLEEINDWGYSLDEREEEWSEY